MNTHTQTLPENIESQLADLELRHKRHQAMLEEHREAKYHRRDRHNRKWHKIKVPAITLI